MLLRRSKHYTSCFSHSTSFANARPRCEILFFSSFGISAYVWPSYSKHASHPATRSVLPYQHRPNETTTHQSLWVLSPARSYPTTTHQRCTQRTHRRGSGRSEMTYIRPSLKHDRLVSRALTIRERANGLSGLVLEAREQLVELLHTEGLQEPFSMMYSRQSASAYCKMPGSLSASAIAWAMRRGVCFRRAECVNARKWTYT